MWRNSETGYGLVHIVLHWLMALTVVGMFALGLYMVELGYYEPWYHRAPALHKSVGLLFAAALLLRLLWRLGNTSPSALARGWSRHLATAMHWLLYAALAALCATGYLIAAADGRAVPVFDWFSLAALQLPVENQEDLAGDVHEILAWFVIALSALHAAAALKHHFIDRDATLRRMLWPRPALRVKKV